MMKSLAVISLFIATISIAEVATAQEVKPPTQAQRDLILAHVKAYSAENDGAKILPTTTAADWDNCSANGAQCMSRDETIAMLAGIKKSVPDFKWEVLDMIRSGDKVVVRGQGSGTPQGTFMGVPVNGKSFKIMSIDIQTIRNGKIVHTFHLEDWAAGLRQITAADPR